MSIIPTRTVLIQTIEATAKLIDGSELTVASNEEERLTAALQKPGTAGRPARTIVYIEPDNYEAYGERTGDIGRLQPDPSWQKDRGVPADAGARAPNEREAGEPHRPAPGPGRGRRSPGAGDGADPNPGDDESLQGGGIGIRPTVPMHAVEHEQRSRPDDSRYPRWNTGRREPGDPRILKSNNGRAAAEGTRPEHRNEARAARKRREEQRQGDVGTDGRIGLLPNPREND